MHRRRLFRLLLGVAERVTGAEAIKHHPLSTSAIPIEQTRGQAAWNRFSVKLRVKTRQGA
jgi:hypothetical protein